MGSDGTVYFKGMRKDRTSHRESSAQRRRDSQLCTDLLLDTESAIDARIQHHEPSRRGGNRQTGLDRACVSTIQNWMERFNQYITLYRAALERYRESPGSTTVRFQQVRGGPDPRRYNFPLDNTEVAAVVMTDADGERRDNGRDLFIHARGDARPKRVFELHKSFMSFHFPLIHLRGEDGWHGGIPWKQDRFQPDRYRLLRDQPADSMSESEGDREDRPRERRRRSGSILLGREGRVRSNDGSDDGEREQDADSDEEEGVEDFQSAKTVTQLRWIRYH